jgi:hypothetical protein
MTKPQVIMSDEVEEISFKLKQSMFDCFKRSTIFERTTEHFGKLVRSLELGGSSPLEAVFSEPCEGQYLNKESSRDKRDMIFLSFFYV